VGTQASRKDLKGPDEFISFTQQTLSWLMAHKIQVIGAIAGVSVLAIAISGWAWYSQVAGGKASAAFAKAMKIMDAPILSKSNNENLPEDVKAYPSEDDKFKAARTEFESVMSRFKGTKVSALSAYFYGECSQRMGDHPKAVDYFKKYIDEAGKSADLTPFAIEGIGISLEAQGKSEDAIKEYQKLTTDKLYKEFTDRGIYYLARLEQKSGKLESAARMLREIEDKYPKSIFIQDVQKLLEQLPKVADSAPPGKKETLPATPDKKAN